MIAIWRNTPIQSAQTITEACLANADGYACTRLQGHDGAHVSQGIDRNVVAVWTWVDE